MLAPLLSEADLAVAGDGSIDPLGLYAIADSLAVRLVPGIRERMAHPRFLTATAVSLSICSECDNDAIATDGVSEPWQVFEWHLVEGLVRTASGTDQVLGVPGREKVASTIRAQVPLSASRYLKAPAVYGFHGVYRLLSQTLGVEAAGRLGEFGFELLATWAEEQRLEGFCSSAVGPGKAWRQSIVDAVKDGMKNGRVVRRSGWSGWQFFRKHLRPRDVGTREAKRTAEALRGPGHGFCRPVLDFLVSPQGREICGRSEDGLPERRFHEALAGKCDPSLRELLTTIMAYETFSRLLQDAFDDCLFAMSRSQRRTPPTELHSLPGVVEAAQRVPDLFTNLVDLLAPFEGSARFQESFSSLAEKLSGRAWVVRLLEHHRTVQRRKPPEGKAPWYERFDDGSYFIWPRYASSSGGRHNDQYVHFYRTAPLWSFARDLGMVS